LIISCMSPLPGSMKPSRSGSLRSKEWVAGIATGMNEIKVSVVDVPVEHSVKMLEFNTWLRRPGRTPKERMDRVRVREILGHTDDEMRSRTCD
jgi:hypothetical protein